MKHYHKLILITLLFVILQQTQTASPYASQEFCKIVEPSTDQTITQALTTSATSVSQNKCVQRFTLDLSNAAFVNQKYIYIEVQFSPFPNPPPEFSMILLEGDTYQPILYSSNNGLYEDATDDDYDAYINSKTFARIVLDTANIQKGGMRYFAVYKFLDNYADDATHYVDYTITARVSSTFQCINNCNGQGDCDANLGQCICYPGFFDSDCSIGALRLNSGVPRSQSVPAQSSAYYYTPYQNADDVVTFSFKMDQPGWNVAIQFNKPNDFLINSRYAFQLKNRNPISVLQSSQDFNPLALPILKNYVGGEIIVFISNPTNSPMYSTVQVDYPVKEKSKLLLTVAIVAGIVLFLIVLGAFITAKCRARAMRSSQSAEIEEAQGAPQGQRGPRANRANPQQPQPVFLTKAEIQKYFPLKQFSDLKTGFAQSACSICLEEFAADSKCHQLYCEHIFHDNCIESWLAKQSNCPNCKSEMNKEAIKKFLKEKRQQLAKPKNPNPESPQIELSINPGNHVNEQPEQADRGNLENSVYENSEENPIELQSPIGSPVASPHSSRMLTGDRYAPNI